MTVTARTIVLAARPVGKPKPSDFRMESAPLHDPGPGEVLLQVLWLTLDPYMRGRMSEGPSYAAATELGKSLPTEAVARVLVSMDPGFQVGDVVAVHDLWRDHMIRRGSELRKLDPLAAPVQTALGVMGMPGMTAYTGLKHIGRPKAGETVVVGAASGAVGALVGQIARIGGARAVGLAGGAEKCAYVVNELGFDACIDRNAPDMAAQLAAACPKGVDVYFELTGGAIFDAVLPLLNPFARVPVCGTIATYNATSLPEGPDRTPLLLRSILTKSLTFRGFIVGEFWGDAPEFYKAMAGWLAEGRVKYREDVTDGLDRMVETFIGMLEGRNFGKTLIRVAV
jgi:NADPH-dependent curcumin reductase CurA